MCYINRFFFIRKEVEKKKQDFVKSCFFDNNFSTLTVQIDDAIKNIFLFSFLQKPDDQQDYLHNKDHRHCNHKFCFPYLMPEAHHTCDCSCTSTDQCKD